jgi:hypothetical protein
MMRFIFLTFLISVSFFFDAMAQKKDSTAIKAIDKSDKVIIRREKKLYERYMDSIYDWRIKQVKLDDVYIPFDLYDCFKQLDNLMEDGVKTKFMEFSDEEVDRKTHGSIGKWIDHKWQLTEGSRLSAYFKKMGVPHPDYMVGIILTTYHRNLHKKDLKVKELVAYFKEMWKKKQKEKAKSMISTGKQVEGTGNTNNPTNSGK